jgi:hypothetical protein
VRQASDAGWTIEHALAGFHLVRMLTRLLDGALLVVGQSAYVLRAIEHASAATLWRIPLEISFYPSHGSLLREIVSSANLPAITNEPLSIINKHGRPEVEGVSSPFAGDIHVEWFEGNFAEDEEDKKHRLGDAAVESHRYPSSALRAGVTRAGARGCAQLAQDLVHLSAQS